MKKSTFKKQFSICTRLLLCLSLFITSFVHAQDPPQYGTPYANVPDPRDVNLYQVHIRPYSAAGNLQGVIARLDSIKSLGINVIYVMPIYPHGTDSRSTPSPYCIKDFKSVATEYGTLTDMRNLVDGAHNRGMAVMLDIAINGTSWDHPWITQHPDWYNQSGGVIQQLASFSDIAALNFSNTSMRAALVDAMRYWIFAANIDGYRCDFANNPPLDFWTNTISNLRGITTHKLLMLAEGDRLQNFQTGFDYNFGDKWYYDALQPIAQSGTSVAQIQTTTNTEYTYATGSQQEVRYTTNHDLQDHVTPFSVFTNHNGVVVNFLVSAYMRGVPFLASGQETDFNQTIPWPYTSVKINWSNNPSASTDFRKILNYRTSSTAIRRGTMTNYSDNNVCAFTKISGSEKVVVMANLRNSTQNYVIPSALSGSYKNAYTNASVTLTSGATQSLSAYQYIVLTNTGVANVPVTGVSVSPTSASIKAGLTQQLSATVSPSNATNQNVTWSSSNTSVATVNASGLVTAVAAGTATITVTTQDGNKTATSAITVTAAQTFTVHFYRPANWGTTIRIYWWAAQPAGVLADGTWPGVAMTNEGSSTWYKYTFTNVTSTNLIFNDGTNQTADLNRAGTDGWYYNGAWYNSQPAIVAVTGVTVSPATATVNAGATTQLTATVSPANATNKNVTWSSSNTSVSTVNSTGLVTGVAAGTATITVTTQDGNKTATSAITVPSTGTIYYNIVNRYQPTYYLYDGGNGQVKYGTNPGSNTLYQWTRVTTGSYVLLKNRSTGNLMHVENQNGAVQCSTGDPTWYSAQWTIADAGSGYNYIQNRWQTNEWIHIENLLGYAQYANPQTGWYSAMWQFVNQTTGSSAMAARLPEVKDISVYPNPVSGKQFYISIPSLQQNEKATLTITNANGKQVLMKTISSAQTTINNQLSAGIYFLNLHTDKFNINKKLIVQ